MKNIKVLGIILLSFYSLVYGQESQYRCVDFELNNMAKSVYQCCYTVTQSNDSIIKDRLISGYGIGDYAVWRRPVKYSFNEKGYLISTEDLFVDDNSKTYYFYNSDNKLIDLKTFIKLENGDYNHLVGGCDIEINDDVIKRTYYTCNSENREKSSSIYIDYYENNLLVRQTGDFPDNNDSILYFYDKNNNQIKEEYVYPNGRKLEWTTEYVYDKKGNILKKVAIEGEGFTKNTYEYFPNGLLKLEENYKEEYNYKYVFDSENNWITKTVYINGLPKFIFEREIHYK